MQAMFTCDLEVIMFCQLYLVEKRTGLRHERQTPYIH